MDLIELAERVQKAEEPDPEMDKAVHRATFRGDPLDPWAGFGDFTRSLDAAMTLVPEGWVFVRLERTRSWPNDPRGDCTLFGAVLMQLHGRGYVETTALTQPNAITAAALRARAFN